MCEHTRAHTQTHEQTHTYTKTHTYVDVHARMRVSTYTHTHTQAKGIAVILMVTIQSNWDRDTCTSMKFSESLQANLPRDETIAQQEDWPCLTDDNVGPP